CVWAGRDSERPAVADARLPAPLDSTGGALEVAWVRGGVERALWRFDYGELGRGLAPAGYSLEAAPFPHTVYPSPESFHLPAVPIPGCHFSGVAGPGTPSVTELFPACADSTARAQYILVGGIDPTRPPDPRFGVRPRGGL